MFGQKKAYHEGYNYGHEDGYDKGFRAGKAFGKEVARELPVDMEPQKRGGGRAQGLYDKIHPDSIMADVDRYLKQEKK